jgi:hypothetical protein
MTKPRSARRAALVAVWRDEPDLRVVAWAFVAAGLDWARSVVARVRR